MTNEFTLALISKQLFDLWELCNDIAGGVAEDDSERAMFGDAPCGAVDRRRSYAQVCADSDFLNEVYFPRPAGEPIPSFEGEEAPF
jgi:hypothetical protein